MPQGELIRLAEAPPVYLNRKHSFLSSVISKKRLAERDQKGHLKTARLIKDILTDFYLPVRRLKERKDIVPLLTATPFGPFNEPHSGDIIQMRNRDITMRPQDLDNRINQLVSHIYFMQTGIDMCKTPVRSNPIAGNKRGRHRYGKGDVPFRPFRKNPSNRPCRPDRSSQRIRVVLHDPSLSQCLLGEYSGLNRHKSHLPDLAAIKIDRDLPFQRITLQNTSLYVLQAQGQDLLKKPFDPSRYIPVIGLQKIRNVKTAPRVLPDQVCLASLHPEICHQNL